MLSLKIPFSFLPGMISNRWLMEQFQCVHINTLITEWSPKGADVQQKPMAFLEVIWLTSYFSCSSLLYFITGNWFYYISISDSCVSCCFPSVSMLPCHLDLCHELTSVLRHNMGSTCDEACTAWHVACATFQAFCKWDKAPSCIQWNEMGKKGAKELLYHEGVT